MTSFDLRNAPFVLLDDSRASHIAGLSYLFHSPDHIIEANSFEDIPGALEALDAAHRDGFHTAGWIAYEVASAFEAKLAERFTKKADEPLIWMMATKHKEPFSSTDVERLFYNAEHGNSRRYSLDVAGPSVDEQEYTGVMDRIQAYLSAGDVYQINYTFPLPVSVGGDYLALYQQLRQNQPVPYGAYIDTGDRVVLSLSPELFLEKKGNTLTARPMKGTAARGRSCHEDQAISDFLQQDEKSRAENLMIVDLIRNDLSRIAEPASVSVAQLFETEKYPTLFQMTSTVTARAREILCPSKLLAAMFPCGSVTGAPKVRAMEIIHDLEKEPRGIYCGTIGHFSPGETADKDSWTLNVPIRTLTLQKGGKGRANIGSGIVADSKSSNEYRECLLKSRFLNEKSSLFSLIETMRLEKGQFLFLEDHLDRLSSSADYFGFNFSREEVTATLIELSQAIGATSTPYRCRLLLNRNGHAAITSEEMENSAYMPGEALLNNLDMPAAGSVAWHPAQTSSSDAYLQHKTTKRELYNLAAQKAAQQGHLDSLFVNDSGNVTEGAISNLFLLAGDKIITPPVSDGVLPGIMRKQVINSLPDDRLRIQSISKKDVEAADALFIGSSLRGIRRVSLKGML